MSVTLTAIEINCETNTVSERALTGEEIAQREADAIAEATRKAEEDAAIQAKVEAKASALAKLATLGLTAEEIAAL